LQLGFIISALCLKAFGHWRKMSSEDEEYSAKVTEDVQNWVKTLAEKGTRSFKITECKDKFMKEPISFLSAACEKLINKKVLSLDPSSRRIAVYVIDEGYATAVKECSKRQQIAAAQAAKKARKVEAIVEPPAKAEDKLDKAVLQPVKKQKVVVPQGVKKISSYFQVQPGARPASAVAPNSTDSTAANENTPSSLISNSADGVATSYALPSASVSCRPLSVPAPVVPALALASAPVAPVPAEVVELFTQAAPVDHSAGKVVAAELMDLVMRLVSQGFQRNSGTVDVAELLQHCVAERGEDMDEAGLQAALRQLEDRNAVMVDEGVVYEV
jgi:hypothetical protein